MECKKLVSIGNLNNTSIANKEGIKKAG